MDFPDVAEELSLLGCKTFSMGDCLKVTLEGNDMIVFEDERGDLVMNHTIAHLGDIPQEQLLNVILSCLDANRRVRPAAFSIVMSKEWEVLEVPLILTTSLPMSLLTQPLLKDALARFGKALALSRMILDEALENQDVGLINA